jgi:hypothetical protein
MIEDAEAPIVPEVRRNREIIENPKPTRKASREENKAFRSEVAFVPLTKRSPKVIN